MKKFGIFVFVLSFIILQTIHAQGDERISNYDTEITIRKDGVIDVTERIDYFFPDARHGITREIPVIKTNENGKKYKMVLDNIVVDKPYTTLREGENVILKIGDPDKTITGNQQYEISYTVSGALTYFPGHDELYWNFVGTKWTVPVARASVAVKMPQSVPDTQLNVKCFVEDYDCSITKSQGSVTVTVDSALEPYNAATFVVGFPKGLIAVLEPFEVVPFLETLIGKMTLAVLILVGIVWYIVVPILIIRRWWKYGRDPKPAMGEVTAWFSPPQTKDRRPLTPAETGSLVDESVDARDIFATIVDLARRGFLKIIETKKGVFDLEKQKDWRGDTQPYEEELLKGIFEKKDRISLKDMNLHKTFETVTKQLYESLVADGFFPNNPQSIRTVYYIIAFIGLATGNILLFLVALFFGKNMPRKTLFGAEQAAVGRSLKNFLVSQEKQLTYQAKNQMMFEGLLPYAVAFGVEKQWAARFKDIVLKQPDWYASSSGGPFNSVVFANNLGRSASVSFASSISAKSSSGFSSGFSGGSSGGGGGGGGGGSW